MKRLLPIIAFCLLQIPIGLVLAAWPRDCVCCIQCPEAGGSGTLVGISKSGHGIVISAAHVFRMGGTQGITCQWPAVGEKEYPAKFLAMDNTIDIAAVDVPNAPKIKLPAGIVVAIQNGSPFSAAGFPSYSRHSIRWTEGAFSGYEDVMDERNMLITHQKVASGYSGGGRFNSKGQYVGPISGTCGPDKWHLDDTFGAGGERMLEFVGRYMKLK